MFKNFNRNTSIKTRIYLGSYSLILGIVITSIIAFFSFNKVNSNFIRLEKLNENARKIIIINNLVHELKRNVSSYIYTGHESIENNVRRDISKLRDELSRVEKINDVDNEAKYRERMKEHIENYSKTFDLVVKELELKNELTGQKLPGLLNLAKSKGVKSQIAIIEVEILKYLNSPSGDRSALIFKNINIARKENPSSTKILNELKDLFLRVTQSIRGYLYLVNVVMAGEALEFDFVSKQIKEKTTEAVIKIKEDIEAQNIKVKKTFLIFLMTFLPLSIFFSWFISSGISKPLLEITKTLKEIAIGNTNIKVPEQDRDDEIGTLSQAAEVFRERTHRLELSNEELSQFAYRTSHDLKAPLVSIIGLTDIIKEDIEGNDYNEVIENLDKISISARKLDSLIIDILNLSKADHLDVKIEECQLEEIAKNIDLKLSNLLKENLVRFEFRDLQGQSVATERVRLEQVLENIISNAIKYSDPEKTDSYVKVSLTKNKKGKTLVISDNGLGIHENYQKDLFRMFKRFHTNVSFGSGLGLYLVKKHLEKMNVKISFESKELQGTTFKVFFSSTS